MHMHVCPSFHAKSVCLGVNTSSQMGLEAQNKDGESQAHCPVKAHRNEFHAPAQQILSFSFKNTFYFG